VVLGDVEEEFRNGGLVVGVPERRGRGSGYKREDGGGYEGEFVALGGVSIGMWWVKEEWLDCGEAVPLGRC
jgi:hypothetical protein